MELVGGGDTYWVWPWTGKVVVNAALGVQPWTSETVANATLRVVDLLGLGR
jgi:hypothetical protein